LNDLLALLKDGVKRVRQHHAIEHATLHILSERFPHATFAGYSDPLGFLIFGPVDSYGLRRVVGDAMLRLQAGESHLAIHANCGTMLASTAMLTALAAMIGSAGQKGAVARFTSMLTWVLGALLVSRPLGLWFQRYTTLPEIADRWLVEVRSLSTGKIPVHRVYFE
jgi:hypothetical protein